MTNKLSLMDLSDVSDNDSDEDRLTIDENTTLPATPHSSLLPTHTDPALNENNNQTPGSNNSPLHQTTTTTTGGTSLLEDINSSGESDEEEDDDDEDEIPYSDSDGPSDGSTIIDEDENADVVEPTVNGHQRNRTRIISSSSDDATDDANKCYICLNELRSQDLGTPESCDHTFCLDCLQTWSRRVNTCPVDRSVFHLILARHARSPHIYRRIPINDAWVEDNPEDLTYCRVCMRPDSEHRMLLCDGCDNGYHCECLVPPIEDIPTHEWFCPICTQTRINRERMGGTARHNQQESDGDGTATDSNSVESVSRYMIGTETGASLEAAERQIPRTLLFERVRAAISESRTNLRQSISDVARDGINGVTSPMTRDMTNDTHAQPSALRDRAVVVATDDPMPSDDPIPSTSGGSRKRKAPSSTSAIKRKKPRKTVSKRKTSTRKTKGTGRKKKKSRVVRHAPVTPKSRIAGRLGLCAPRRGCSIPRQRTVIDPTLDTRRSEIGVDSLSVAGGSLNLLPSGNDEAGPPTAPPTARYSQASLTSRMPLPRPIPLMRLIQAGSYILVYSPNSPGTNHQSSNFKVAQVVDVSRSLLTVVYMVRPNQRKPHRWMWPMDHTRAVRATIPTRNVIPLSFPAQKAHWPRPIFEFPEILEMM